MKYKASEKSFTLIETMIAVGLLATLLVEVSAVQGNAVYFSEYGEKSSKALYLAKSLMSRIEYRAAESDFSEMEVRPIKEGSFVNAKDFSYSLSIEEWKLPIAKLLGGGGLRSSEENTPSSSSEDSGEGDFISDAIKQAVGDELLKVAHVEVFWGEGAVRDSVALSLLLTNQKKLEEFVSTLDKGPKKNSASTKKTPSSSKPPSPAPSL